MAESYTGDAYCVKCKEKRDFTGEVHETNGRRMAKGICPVCGTKLNRILGKACSQASLPHLRRGATDHRWPLVPVFAPHRLPGLLLEGQPRAGDGAQQHRV